MKDSGVREVGVVEELWRYPVSALGGERLETATLAERGLVGDRAWAVVDASTGEAAAPERAKRWRPATHVKARSIAEDEQIAVPGGPWLGCRDEQARLALTAHFGFAVELRREVGSTEEPHIADGGATLRARRRPRPDDFGARGAPGSVPGVEQDRRTPLPAEHRRCDRRSCRAAVELDWVDRRMRIGDATIRVLGPCARCSFPTLSQRELPRDDRVLRAIAKTFGGSFGVLCEVVTSGDSRDEEHGFSWPDGVAVVLGGYVAFSTSAACRGHAGRRRRG